MVAVINIKRLLL